MRQETRTVTSNPAARHRVAFSLRCTCSVRVLPKCNGDLNSNLTDLKKGRCYYPPHLLCVAFIGQEKVNEVILQMKQVGGKKYTSPPLKADKLIFLASTVNKVVCRGSCSISLVGVAEAFSFSYLSVLSCDTAWSYVQTHFNSQLELTVREELGDLSEVKTPCGSNRRLRGEVRAGRGRCCPATSTRRWDGETVPMSSQRCSSPQR